MAAEFELFKSKVIRALRAEGFSGNAEEFADCLDMSFEEVKHLHHNMWGDFIRRDLAEYKKENPHEFVSKY